MVYCASTFPKAQTFLGTLVATLTPSPLHSTDVLARRSVGKRLPRLFAITYAQLNRTALRRPLELGQYLSIRYTERLAEAGIERSVGSVGDSFDNALAETINGLYKAEVIWPKGPWRTIDAVEYATLHWVDWFNNRRLLEPIGYVPPAEYERAWYEAQQGQAMAA
jgi:transposase InsO family protein